MTSRWSRQPREPPGAAARTALQLAAIAVAAVVLRRLEQRAPLRPPLPSWPHLLRNLLTGLPAGLLVLGVERPLALRLGHHRAARGGGLLERVADARLRTALGMCLLDYGLYHWHRAAHRSPRLWRLHRGHHADRVMNGSTAARFSLPEVAGGSALRLLQTWVLGIPPQAYRRWQTLMLASILFHHSNLRLPSRLERPLSLLIATPRLHGLHHSVRAEERQANLSSGLSAWDLLHGTYRYPQRPIRVGLLEPEAASLR